MNQIRRILSGLVMAALVATVTGCGIRGLRVPQSPLLKIFVARSGHIAFVGTDGNLYLADQSGSTTKLTNDAQSSNGSHVTYVSPVWSPDGRQLAYARYLTDPASGNSTASLQVLDLKTHRDVNTFTSEQLQPFYFDWAPDGRRIAVLSDHSGTLELGVVRAERPGSYHEIDSGSPYYWAWTADGNKIVSHTDFTAKNGGRVSIIPVDDPQKKVDLRGDFELFQAPAVLPNGDIVTVESSGTSSRLAAVSPSGTGSELFAPNGEEGFLFSVSPNGKLLAYLDSQSIDGTMRSVLHVWDLVAHKELQALDKLSVLAFYWAPDSSKIAFFIPAAGEKVDGSYAQIPSLPHVSLEVLDVRSGKFWNLAAFPLTQGLLSTLPYTDQYQHSQTIWSPNSSYLVYTAYTPRGLPGVFVAEADGNIKPTKIADGDFAVWSWK